MTELALRITLDASQALQVLGDLRSLLPELRKRSAQAFERLVDLVELFPELLVIEVDGGAAAIANHLRMRAQPTRALADLVAALRAGDIHLAVIKRALDHLRSPQQEQHNPLEGPSS